jgi:hypothetical protein
MDMNLSISLFVKKNIFLSVGILDSLTKIAVSCKDGAAENKIVGIKSRFVLNVTVRYSFEGNWMLKQPNIITLERVVSKVKISKMLKLF